MHVKNITNTIDQVGAGDEILHELENVQELSTLPTSFLHIMRALRDPNATVKKITKVIELDQAITMKILKLINSSFYGLSRTVSSVQQAIVLLGANTLENIVMSVSIFKAMSGMNKNELFDREAFWQHSIGVGVISRFIAAQTRCCSTDDGFVAGIVHDIGKVIIDQYFPDHFKNVVRYVHTHKILFYNAERELLGVDHAEIGAKITDKWRLPPKLVEVIEKHHNFSPEREDAPLIALIQIADMAARKFKIGSGGDNLIPPIYPATWEQLNLDPTSIDDWQEAIHTEVEDAKELLDMIESP